MAEQHEKEFPATRTSRAWWALAVGLLILLLIIVFMAQNGRHVDVKFLWIKGNIALGIALFAAAIMGGLAVLLLGAARMLQIRRQARRAHRQAASAD
jgi:uncharacterized integral membrane protein